MSVDMLTTQAPSGESHSRPMRVQNSMTAGGCGSSLTVVGAARALMNGRRYEAGTHGALDIAPAF